MGEESEADSPVIRATLSLTLKTLASLNSSLLWSVGFPEAMLKLLRDGVEWMGE
jgi:hypothetical protein